MLPVRPLVLRPREAAAFLQCSKATFYRWAQRRDFPAPIKIDGGSRRYFVRDLTAWLKGHQLNPAGSSSPFDPKHTTGSLVSGAGGPALLRTI